jgi:hypothetical protein
MYIIIERVEQVERYCAVIQMHVDSTILHTPTTISSCYCVFNERRLHPPTTFVVFEIRGSFPGFCLYRLGRLAGCRIL